MISIQPISNQPFSIISLEFFSSLSLQNLISMIK